MDLLRHFDDTKSCPDNLRHQRPGTLDLFFTFGKYNPVKRQKESRRFLLHFHEKMFTVFGASIAAFSIKTKQKSATCSALYWYFDGTLLILAVQIH